MTIDELKAFLLRRAGEVWRTERKNYHLARVAPELQKEGIDYKEVIGPDTKLSDFAKTVEGLDFFQDQNLRANVGVRPSGEVEPVQEDVAKVQSSIRGGAKSRRQNRRGEEVVIGFLKSLGRLDDQALKDVQIPIHVLVRLLQK